MGSKKLLDVLQRVYSEVVGIVVLDGGLATHLEALGADLSTKLWSARLLRDDPDKIKRAHLDFFEV